MSRYIDADALKMDIDLSKGATVFDMAINVIKMVKEAPTADAVEVVRCRDCKHGTLRYGSIKCTVDEDDCGIILYHEPHHYCGYGERREK